MLSSEGHLFISSLASACACPGKLCQQTWLCQGALPAPSPACALAFQSVLITSFQSAPVRSAASKSPAGRRRQQALLLLLLFLFLFLLQCEPFSHHILFPPRSLCAGVILVGQHRGGEELILAECGPKHIIFQRGTQFLVGLLY